MISENEFNDAWNHQVSMAVADNYNHNRVGKEAADHTINIMADYCEMLIIEYKKAYYIGTPLVKDRIYDKIEHRLELLRPTSQMLIKVGS